VIGHDDEAVEFEAAFIAMLKEDRDEEFGVGCSLEVAMLLEGRDGDGVRALLLADCRHARESIPHRLKPLNIFGWKRGPSLKAWRT